jgi:hypothetical protein
MEKETLFEANKLNKKIKDLEEAKGCFYFYVSEDDEKLTSISTNPKLFIEVDDCEGGREKIEIPVEVNNELIVVLQNEIEKTLAKAKKRFKDL